MTCKSTLSVAWIAPGIAVPLGRQLPTNDHFFPRLETEVERLQRLCNHKRDQQGTCYSCGHREAK